MNNKKEYINYKNRGLSLENLINKSNEYYRFINKALIYKKPTPIHVVKVDNNHRINDAYFEIPSTTDYNGIYKEKYIDFEAKETKSKSSFNLNLLHKHQYDHLINVKEHGGISFIVVYFIFYDEYYLIFIDKIDDILRSGKKSIPYTFFKENAYKIELTIYPKLNYLKIIDDLYF